MVDIYHLKCLENDLLVNPNTLILMALCIDHNISFVQDKHIDFFNVKHTELGAPIKNLSRCADNDVVVQFAATSDYMEQIKIEFISMDFLSFLRIQNQNKIVRNLLSSPRTANRNLIGENCAIFAATSPV